MKLEFKPKNWSPITITYGRSKEIALYQGDDIIYLEADDLPRFVHELQIIANEVTK